jgi:hypothetical protein
MSILPNEAFLNVIASSYTEPVHTSLVIADMGKSRNVTHVSLIGSLI